MNKYANDMINLVADTLPRLRKADQAIRDFETEKKPLLRDDVFNDQRNALVSDYNNLVMNATIEAQNLAEAEAERVKTPVALNGAELTPDADLLRGGFDLKASDLAAMYERAQGNATMQRLIAEYGEKHNMPVGGYFTEAQRLADIDTMLAYARSAFSRPMFDDWTDKRYLESVLPDSLR